MTEQPSDMRPLTPFSVLSGLVFRPADTMWRLREEGPLWLSLVAAWVLGGMGIQRTLVAVVAFGVDRPLWVYWMAGVALLAAEFAATMLLIHLSALLVWRGSPNPVMPAGMRTLLRLGGYWSLPSSLTVLVLSLLVLLAVRLGAAPFKAAVALIIPLALAGMVWTIVFRLRMLRTVYLATWGQAIAMGIILVIVGAVVGAPLNNLHNLHIGPESALAQVGWELHRSLGADQTVIEALEAVPQANASLRVLVMSRAPEPGDLVAFYRGRETPPVHHGARLPKPIVIGRVLAVQGQEVAAEDVAGEIVPDGHLLVRPVSDPRDPPHPAELVPIGSVAGQVPENDVRMHLWITRLLLR